MVGVTARRRTVGDANAGPANEQTQHSGTEMRLGSGFVLQPGDDGCPTGWACHGGRIRTDLGTRYDDGG